MYARLAENPEEAVASALKGEAGGLEVPTSGSSGHPRSVQISTDALIASAKATHERLSGPGRWLLALPTDHIAGAQVLIRSSLSGKDPVRLTSGSFTPESFLLAADDLFDSTDGGVPHYTSLVPTQLHRLLDSDLCGVLNRFSAVLVGGAPLGIPRESLPQSIVETYGATETSGGCVYDGIPLDGVRVKVDGEGRVSIGGDVVADSYADGNDGAFRTGDGTRWYQTPDLGVLKRGALKIIGRADDVILTGGHKVDPVDVEGALLALSDIDQAAVVGVPDPEWGCRVVAVIVLTEGSVQSVDAIRTALASSLPAHALPKEIRVARSLPLLPGGKIDRTSILRHQREEG